MAATRLRVALAVAGVMVAVAQAPARPTPPTPPPTPHRVGGYLPPGTPATAWLSNVVLTYMDSRSFKNSSNYDASMDWTVDKFTYLTAFRNTHTAAAPAAASQARRVGATAGPPIADTFFDGFLLIGIDWFEGKNFWQGEGACCTNASDWMGFLQLQLSMGVAQLDAASAQTQSALGMPSAWPTYAPGVIMMIPYPDTRQADFGAIAPGGPSLNFSGGDARATADRTAAMTWFVDRAIAAWAAAAPAHLRHVGFYHFLEEVSTPGDADMLPRVAAHIHAAGTGLRFWWVPYFGSPGGHTAWRAHGFDAVALQPNYAFHNSSAATRFAAVAEQATELCMGVEMELPMYTRNPQVKNWQTSFTTYLDMATAWGFGSSHAYRAYYMGNAFVEMAANASLTGFYDRLYWFVKGTYPYPTPLPNVTWPNATTRAGGGVDAGMVGRAR